MTLLIGVVLVLIVAGVVAGLVSGAIAGGLDDPASTVPARGLDAGPVDAEAVASLRFVSALRGYKMDQVDEALARLADELAARDEELARLRAAALVPAGADGAAPVSFLPAEDSAGWTLPGAEPIPAEVPAAPEAGESAEVEVDAVPVETVSVETPEAVEAVAFETPAAAEQVAVETPAAAEQVAVQAPSLVEAVEQPAEPAADPSAEPKQTPPAEA